MNERVMQMPEVGEEGFISAGLLIQSIQFHKLVDVRDSNGA